MTNSADPDQLALQKPTDLDLRYLLRACRVQQEKGELCMHTPKHNFTCQGSCFYSFTASPGGRDAMNQNQISPTTMKKKINMLENTKTTNLMTVTMAMIREHVRS